MPVERLVHAVGDRTRCAREWRDTTSTSAAAGLSDLPATVTQQHSMAFQLKAKGFTIGSCCAIKE